MNPDVRRLLEELGGLATTRQLLGMMTREQLGRQARCGEIIRVRHGVYASCVPDMAGRLRALDVFLGQEAVACLGTAAALYGSIPSPPRLFMFWILPSACAPKVGRMVHQRHGAPLRRIAGRLDISPAWNAIEVARQLTRPRALATLDAALHSGRARSGRHRTAR